MNRAKVLKALRTENTWHVVNDGKDAVLLAKQFGQKRPKVIQLTLTCTKEGIHIRHPNYEFKSTISHFCSVQKDIRLSLNKTFLTSIIRTLKETGLWEAVTNKDFLVVNKNNSKSNKNTVKRELGLLLS